MTLQVRNNKGCIEETEPFIPVEACANLSFREVFFSIPELAANSIGDTIKVPILVDSFFEVSQFLLDLSWDPNQLSLYYYELSSQLPEVQPKQRLGAFSYSTLDSASIVLNYPNKDTLMSLFFIFDIGIDNEK